LLLKQLMQQNVHDVKFWQQRL